MESGSLVIVSERETSATGEICEKSRTGESSRFEVRGFRNLELRTSNSVSRLSRFSSQSRSSRAFSGAHV